MSEEKQVVQRKTEPGICIPWEEKVKEYEKIMGDEEVLQKSWEEIDTLAYLFVWFVLIAA
ncbi:hypothetical protein H8E77_02850 [bacterium]|nr:hypothetical protein [bacterium]